VYDLGRPVRRLGVGGSGAGISRWGGGVRIIVFPPFQSSAADCFGTWLVRLGFWSVSGGCLVVRLVGW
jgi:hypothetical protein